MMEVQSKSVKFFGLLHLASNENSVVNASFKSFDEQIKVYVRNACLLSRSLRAAGIEFVLLTNDVRSVQFVAEKLFLDLSIEGITCSTPVPSGIRFYSAHFKLDAYKYIAEQDLWWAALCDLDMVCIQNTPPAALLNCINNQIPLHYDISDQVMPAYGHERVLRDVELVSGDWSDGRWSGGEFVAGPPSFFKKLAKKIDTLLPNYFKAICSLHHVGDEAYTTAAIQMIQRESFCVFDAGSIGIVGRYWSIPVRHQQRSIKYFEKCFLLHLPADKNFLSCYFDNRNWDPEKFIIDYRRYQKLRFAKRLLIAAGSLPRRAVGKLFRMIKARVSHA